MWSNTCHEDDISLEFQRSLWPALAASVDVFVCSVPAIFCRLFLGLGKPVFGYLALPPLHGVPPGSAQMTWYGEFRGMLTDAKNVFASFNPWLSAAVAWQFGTKRGDCPAVRLFGLHTKAVHVPVRKNEVLVARHGKAQAVQECLLNLFTARVDAWFELRFVQFTDMLVPPGGAPTTGYRYNASLDFQTLASFRAALFWPNDVTLVLFYELYTTCMPLFVPKQFWRHMHGQSTLSLSEGEDEWRLGSPPPCVPSPFTARHFEAEGSPFVLDPGAALYWSRYSDFARFPHVQQFEGVPNLLQLLLHADLSRVSSLMRQFNNRQLIEAAGFWRRLAGRWVDSRPD
eukprot:TRINITY_DN35647_c0_g1_i1.p1 TRINITY_DN35647_c0_g1~~TRINITY_DN35647_c0_g1_i1.p1  ORF type:complete len:343 (+),score=36.63 TRINITY_DN35647_c0_g1_i1:80-1108(+)